MCAKQKDFCTTCRKETTYTLGKKDITRTINGKEYAFCITVAICDECGEETSFHGLIDQNINEIKKQYLKYQRELAKEKGFAV